MHKKLTALTLAALLAIAGLAVVVTSAAADSGSDAAFCEQNGNNASGCDYDHDGVSNKNDADDDNDGVADADDPCPRNADPNCGTTGEEPPGPDPIACLPTDPSTFDAATLPDVILCVLAALGVEPPGDGGGGPDPSVCAALFSPDNPASLADVVSCVLVALGVEPPGDGGGGPDPSVCAALFSPDNPASLADVVGCVLEALGVGPLPEPPAGGGGSDPSACIPADPSADFDPATFAACVADALGVPPAASAATPGLVAPVANAVPALVG